MNSRNTFVIFTLSVVLTAFTAKGQAVRYTMQKKDSVLVFTLSNAMVSQQVFIRDGGLAGDRLSGEPSFLASSGNPGQAVSSDGDFALKMMWTGWSAPGDEINADVQASFNKKDYRYERSQVQDMPGGGKELQLYFSPSDPSNTILLRLTYQLLPGKFYARRRIGVRDTVKQSNWLDTFLSRAGDVSSDEGGNQGARVIKKGAFGQPAAINFGHTAVFFG